MINRLIFRIRDYVVRPRFEDEEMDRQASLLYASMRPVFVMTLVLIPVLPLIGAPLAVLIPVLLMLAVETMVFTMLHRGLIHRASLVFIVMGWVITTFPAFIQGGITSPFALFTILWVVITGLLLERDYLVGVLILTMLEVTALLLVSSFNLIPSLLGVVSPIRYWNVVMIVLYVSGTLIRLAVANLRAALENARHIYSSLETANQELVMAREDLENRVNERTADLERRARELQASSEVVRAIASIRDIDTLLSELTHLLSRQFDFYYAAVFVLDENQQALVMHSSNTQVGQDMIRAGFSVPLDTTSIISTAVRTRKPYLAADVSKDLMFLPTEELSETRSELALPLIAGDKVLGALDLQSSEIAAFTAQDLGIMQTLANQIAIAIENAQLFSQNQQSLESLQRAYTSLSQEGWQRLLRSQPDLAFRAGSLGAPAPAGRQWRPEMVEAMQRGEVIKTDPWTLAVPIKIRDQANGVIRLRKPAEATEWSEDEIRLVTILSDRLSNALESARLYEETRRRAERERLTGEITAKMRASNDQKAILQIAAQELRKALQADRAHLSVQAVPLQTPDEPDQEPAPIDPPENSVTGQGGEE
jgi:GAF domain-containing protein